MNIQPKYLIPLRDMIVVCPVEDPVQTPSGLLLPEQRLREPPTLGLVERVGPGYWEESRFVPNRLRIGDIVLFASFAGFRWQSPVDGKLYVILRERDVHCVVAENSEEAESLARIHRMGTIPEEGGSSE